MYLICNFSIKPLTCVAFEPDCLKRNYGVNHTIESVDKIFICYIWIIKVFMIRKRSSFQGLFIDINWVILSEWKVSSLCLLYFPFRIFLVQYILLWSEIVLIITPELIAVLITPEWEMLSCAFVKIWSIIMEVLQVILVGQFTNYLKPYIEQNSLIFKFRAKSLYNDHSFLNFIKNAFAFK